MNFGDHRKRMRRKNLPVKAAAAVFLVLMCAVTAWHWTGDEGGPVYTDGLLTPEQAASLPEPEEEIPETEETMAAAYFAAYRLDREDARAEELTLLTEILSDTSISEDARAEAESRKIAIAAAASHEAEAENLLDAGGFGETVVILGDRRATVIVDVEMDAVKATKIAETVDSVSGCGFENVVVVNR